MDNPGTSLFQGPDIKINNSQNNEEEEDLEDQRRRKEELQNLLTAALDDFNYDESTVNSSTNISAASVDEVQQNYRQTSEPNEQLKILYDVRLREISNIKAEYDNYKEEKAREIGALKNKLLLSEAEMRQQQISLKNAETLLVEKTGHIAELKVVLNNKDIQMKNYEKTIENFQIELCTYQSTINELQLQVNNSPFNLGAKRFNSEELQRAHQEQIVKLETLLDEQTRAAKMFEKEKRTLQQELENFIELRNKGENDDKDTMKALTKTLEDAQQQCKDLLDVVEMLTKENQHLQERINETNAHNIHEETQHQENSSDNKVLMGHIEKIKKMLLDKSVQMDTLNAKLKHYETDIKELLEYRQLKCDVYKKDFQLCENKDHTKSLLLMQNDLQNYRRTIEDKNQQILTLNSTNKDLQEKIEEMLLQTRNDIQNLSHKYSLPQLEQMTEELKNAEEQVKELQEKLDKSEERRLSLVQKLQKNDKNYDKTVKKEFETQLANLKKNAEKDKTNLENQVKKLQKDLEISSAEIKSLKQFTEELIDQNAKLKLNLKEDQLKSENTNSEPQQMHEAVKIKNEYHELKEQLNQVMAHLQKNKTQKDNSAEIASLEYDMEEFLRSLKESDIKGIFEQKIRQWKNHLDVIKTNSGIEADKTIKAQYKETMQKLREAQQKIKTLEETLEDLTTAKTIAEGEKCTYQFQVKDCENQLEHACKSVKYLENELEALTKTLAEKDELISQLKQNSMKGEIWRLKDELSGKENALQICEEDKKEIIELLQKTKSQLEETKSEALKLQNEVTEVRDKAVRRNLEKELKEAENHLEQSRIEEGNVYETEHFKKCLQAEILKNELKLREDLQQEYLRKLKDIEMKYQKACNATNELYKEQVDKMKNQEARYREHLAKILAECAQKINKLENDKHDLITQINDLNAEYSGYKRYVFTNEEKYKQLITKIQLDAEKNVDEWKHWSKRFVSNCLQIETISKKSRDNILTGMKKVDSEIAVIEKSYKDKLRKCLKDDKY